MYKYDVAVIGSGIGGLISGALLSKEGCKVAVFEKEQYPGGLCSSFKRKGFTFDVAIDSIGGMSSGGLLWSILEELNIGRKVEFIELSPVRRAIFPDFHIDIKNNIDSHKKDLIELFPPEKTGIKNLFEIMEEIYSQSMFAIFHDDRSRIPAMMKWIGKSYKSLLDEYITDERLKAFLASYSTFIGVPASDSSSIAAVNLLMHYVKGGAYRVKGGVSGLAECLADKIRENGGDIFLGEKVVSLNPQNGRVNSLKTDKNRYVEMKHIVSAMDLKTLINNMLPEECVDKFKKKSLNDLEESGSFVIVYMGTDQELDISALAPSIGYFTSYNMESMLNTGDNISFGISIPSLVDDTAAAENCNNIVLHYPLSARNTEDKEKIADRLIEISEKFIPGLSEHISFRSTADDKTISRYTGNFNGAAYGWKQKPGFYFNLPLFREIASNLYIAGHWSGFGGGIAPSAISAVRSAEDILEKKLINI